MSKTITTAAGIGDFIWLIQKLINQPDPHHWILPSGEPRRAHQLAPLLPKVISSIAWKDNLGYRTIKAYGYKGLWKHTPAEFYLQANTHLEEGNRIETFLPDLATSYRIEWETTMDDMAERNRIMDLVPWIDDRRFIAIYTSAYQKDARWKGWEEKEWLEFIKMFPKHYTFVIVGALWDAPMAGDLMPMLTADSIPYVNTVGQPLGVVIEVLKRCEAFVGFPSGLSILNETLGAGKTLMFYPQHLHAMVNTWADPARIESGDYKGCLWCVPEKIYSWIENNWKV
jgi:hypothetical protein